MKTYKFNPDRQRILITILSSLFAVTVSMLQILSVSGMIQKGYLEINSSSLFAHIIHLISGVLTGVVSILLSKETGLVTSVVTSLLYGIIYGFISIALLGHLTGMLIVGVLIFLIGNIMAIIIKNALGSKHKPKRKSRRNW